jgi:hypothetical protein
VIARKVGDVGAKNGVIKKQRSKLASREEMKDDDWNEGGWGVLYVRIPN